MDTRLKVGLAALGAVALLSGAASGCDTDADVASQNISTASEQFQIARRIVVINTITDKYLMTVEGKCSLEYYDGPPKTEIICKLNDGTLVKHVVQRSDNVVVMVEQTTGTKVSTDQYTVIFKPEALVPNFDRP